jgi:glycosyltransferase involved in cell wall biosynthesis
MRIWLVMVGEPLPTDGPGTRLMRTGLLAERLAAMGHDVVWWTSSFDHYRKRQRAEGHWRLRVSPGYEIQLVHAPPYRRNTSLRRLANHAALARGFRALAPAEREPPDVVLCSIPTVELAQAVVEYARARGIPVVTDVRDLHPDQHVERLPRALRWLGRIAGAPMARAARRALAGSTAVTAVSASFVEWGLRRAGRAATERDAVFPLGYPELRPEPEAAAAAGSALRERGVDPSRRIVWFIGQMNQSLDLGTPIRAARLLHQAGEERVQFVFAGAGNMLHRWQGEAAGLPNVVFTGWADLPAITWLRSAAWVGLAPYRADFHAVGNKVSEYMSGRLPILLSGQGDARERVLAHGCGLLFGADGGVELRDHLLRLLDEPELHARLAAAGRAAFEANYDAALVYGRFAAHLLTLAAPGSAEGAGTTAREHADAAV